MATRLFGQSARVPSAEARLRRLSQGIATPWTDGRHSVFAGQIVLGQTNIGLGLNALSSARASTYNIGIGEEALYHVTTGGTHNIGIGYRSLYTCTTADHNVGIGYETLYSMTTSDAGGQKNVGIGYQAGYAITSGYENIAIGELSLSTTTTGVYNIAIGAYALSSLTSSYRSNVAIGVDAAKMVTDGENNVFIGFSVSCVGTSTGDNNVAIGANANIVGNGGCCVFLGAGSGRLATGSGNVFLGYDSGTNETGSNKLYIANTNTATPLIYGEFDTPLLKINAPFTCTGSLTVGSGGAGVDYTLTFDGETNNGVLTWMEDEDYFSFGDDLFVPAGESLYFRDTAISLTSSDDGHLDLTADVQIDLNGITLATDKLAFTQTDQNEYIDSLADGYLDLCATTAIRFRNATADTDVLLEFFGTSATGQFYWMEDEDYFRFVDCLKTEGGRKVNVAIATTTYSVLATDEAVVCNSATAFTVSLPAASGSGRKLYVKNINTGTVTVAGNGSDTIDGVTTQALGRWDAVVLIDYAANAWIIV